MAGGQELVCEDNDDRLIFLSQSGKGDLDGPVTLFFCGDCNTRLFQELSIFISGPLFRAIRGAFTGFSPIQME